MFSSLHIQLLSFSLLFLEQMSPLMRRQWGPKLRKRVMWRHCAAGWKWGVPARLEEEAWGLLIEVNLIYLPFWYLQWLVGVLPPCSLFIFYFTVTEFTTVGQFTAWRGMAVGGGGSTFGDRGVGEVGGSSGRLRGGRFLWASEGSNVAFLHVLSPTTL